VKLPDDSTSHAADARYFSRILDAIADPVFVKDEQHRWVMLNDACCEFMGRPREALLGRSDPDFFPPEEAAVFWAMDEAVLGGGGENVSEESFTDAHGVRHDIVTKKSLFVAEDGRKFIVGIIRDHTERKQHEREIARHLGEVERQQHLIGSVIENAPAGLAYLDRNLVLRWINPEYVRLLGKPVSYFIGRQVFTEIATDMREILEPAIDKAVSERTRVELREVTIPDQPGRFWDISYVPVVAREGEIDGVMVFSQDVTDRVERERLQRDQIARLQQLDKLKDQFVSMLSHELRTPIHTILGMATILEDELAGPLTEEQGQYLGRMIRVTEGLLSLVNDLLDMSLIQSGQFVISPRPIGLPEVISGVLANLAPLAQEKHQTLTDDTPADLPLLDADEQRIGQVLANLVGNAIKFTPEGGHITVSARQEGDRVRCEVRDDGPGIAVEDLPRLFKRFALLDPSNTRPTRGTGLGLVISKSLVEAHGGTIGVESEKGRGSTFWFSLPLSP
jgi:PAS domain S-box-containing protein